MPNPFFKFKQFTIFHDKCAMKVGTDGVLLGAWANCTSKTNILDIGTGTGLIALMLAQRQQDATITAIELNKDAFDQATENIQNSPFSKRVHLYHKALQSFTPQKSFDLIVSNPPYFLVSSSSPDSARNSARQMENLDPLAIFAFAKEHLTENGLLALIFPSDNELSVLANAFNLYPIRKTWLKGNAQLPAKRLLWEFCKKPTDMQEHELIIEEARHKYSQEFNDLVNEFYLHL